MIPEFDTPKWHTLRDELLERWLLGNSDAVDCFLAIGRLAEVWDDLIDGDKPVPDDAIHGAFITALFDLPSNPFYNEHQAHLRPLMMAGINAWLDANALQHEPSPWADVWAYALRDWYMELFAAIALIVGGFDHMRAVSLEARRFFQAESYTDYLAKLEDAQERL